MSTVDDDNTHRAAVESRAPQNSFCLRHSVASVCAHATRADRHLDSASSLVVQDGAHWQCAALGPASVARVGSGPRIDRSDRPPNTSRIDRSDRPQNASRIDSRHSQASNGNTGDDLVRALAALPTLPTPPLPLGFASPSGSSDRTSPLLSRADHVMASALCLASETRSLCSEL